MQRELKFSDTKQTQAISTQKIKAKRTAKNSVFLDLFQDKKNLLALYQTLHPEDTDATEDTLDIVTIDNVLTDNLYNDYSDFLFIPIIA